ncbi:MAG: hypothetical protein H6618_03815 [Deltaproteobacteria bacterium]|nr:hypothetical protein [Deltaproteobacteria bacterium]
MHKRSLILFRMSLMSRLRRLRYDLAKESVVAFCALVLLALFAYIFDDFINEEIRKISPGMQRAFGQGAGLLLSFIGILLTARMIRQELSAPGNVGDLVRFLGEDPQVLRSYRWLSFPVLIGFLWLPLIFSRRAILVRWSLSTELIHLFSCLLISSALAFFYRIHLKKREKKHRSEVYGEPAPASSPLRGMLIWRFRNLLLRNPYARLCLLPAVLLPCPGFFLQNPEHPLLFLLVLMSGLCVAAALIIQIAADLESSWFEKNLGVSHDQWLLSVLVLALTVAGLHSLLILCMMLVSTLLSGGILMSVHVLKLAAVTLVPPFMVPFLCLQIDGRRVLAQLLSVSLCSLFVATAVYASLFSLLLLPLIAYYGLDSQKGRFYRA